jgi:hypothetical protein
LAISFSATWLLLTELLSIILGFKDRVTHCDVHVIVLSVVMLNAIIMNAAMICVIMLCILVSIVMLIVMALTAQNAEQICGQ